MNFKDHIEHLKTFFTPSVKNVILLIRWLITAFSLEPSEHFFIMP